MRIQSAMATAVALWAVAGCSGSRPGTNPDAGSGGAAGAAGGSAGGQSGSAGAGGAGGGGQALIVVNTPSGRVATGTVDGYCDLLEAVRAANTNQPVNECPGGNGADRIVLTPGASYPLATTLRITESVSIGLADGATGTASISAAPGFTVVDTDRWSTCLVYAATTTGDGIVSFADVALSQAPALTVTGACTSFGALVFRRATVTGFRKSGLSAYCLPELGCDHEMNHDQSTTLTVLNSLVSDNRSPDNGGGIYSEGSGAVLTVQHSAIVDNVAQAAGGGLYFGGGWNTHMIQNSTVSGNAAGNGAGVFVSFASCTASYLYLFNSTVTKNIATYSGGGLEFHGNTNCYAQDVTVNASIIAGNTSTTSTETNINADWTGGMFGCDRGSLIYVAPGYTTPNQQMGAAPCRFDVADPLLTPLLHMGGVSDLPVHVPRHGSPAIDAAVGDKAQAQQRDGWVVAYDKVQPPEWMLFDRVVDGDGDGMADRDVGAYEVNDVWQAELLAVNGKGPGAHAVVTTPEGYERGAGTSYLAGTGAGEFVTYVVPVAEAGSYAISMRVREAADGAQVQAAIADTAAGPWTDLGPAQDTFAATDTFATLDLSTGHTFAAAGPKLLRFTVTGKNTASTGRALYLDSIRLRPLP